MTVKEVLEKVEIEPDMTKDIENYPHIDEFFKLLRKGRAEEAYGLYEFFNNRKEFYLDRKGVVKARTRRGNLRNRLKYGGNNFTSKAKKYFKPNVYKKQNGLCNICKNPFPVDILTLDHIIKVSDGGEPLSYKNFQLLCKDCHKEKDNYKKGCEAGFITGRAGVPWIKRD